MKKETFEDYLKKVEESVKSLESGDLSLDDSLVKYETGVQALRQCYEILGKTKKKIDILMKDKEGNLRPEPFDTPADQDTSAQSSQTKKKGTKKDNLF